MDSGDIMNNLTALQNMLNPKTEDDELDRSDVVSRGAMHLSPGSIGPKKAAIAKQPPPPKIVTKDIWDEDELASAPIIADQDPRPRPEYEIIYKQAVTSEDMYLGMSGRDPSIASCEDMIVRVCLPGAVFADIQLDVEATTLNIRSPGYRLNLSLPHRVDSDNGKAQWDAKTSKLRYSNIIRQHPGTLTTLH